MMFKRVTTVGCVIVVFAMTTMVVFAASPTPSEAEASDDASMQENIKERLKKAVDNQIKGLSSNEEKRGFVGTVKRVSEETLTVETRKGTQIIPLSGVSILQDGKAFLVKNIEIDSQVIVMGYQNGEDFEARRVLVLKKPLQSVKKTVFVGTVKKIDKLAVTITTRENEEKSFSLSPKVVLEDNSGETIKLTDIDVDQQVLLITVADDESTKAVKESSGRVVRLHSLVSAEDASPKPTEKTTAKPTAKVTATKTPTKVPTKTPTESADQ